MANKSRLLFLLKYLCEQTDDNVSVTSAQLQQVLTDAGFPATGRTIRDDLATLCDAGYDVIADERPGVATTYHIGARTFETPELQILIDAVSAARFISVDKSSRLIDKLISLAGVSEVPLLKASRLVARKVKAENNSLYYILALIDQAIAAGRKISFQYETYGPDLSRTLRHNGEVYVCSPYVRVWSEDRYYLLCWSDKHQSVVPFRIDHMRLPSILTEAAVPAPEGFDVTAYSSSVIRMFEGEEELVTLRCTHDMAPKLVDRFGLENVEVISMDEHTFTTRVHVSVSVTFYGWLLQYTGQMRILAPQHVREGYGDMLTRAMQLNDLAE